MKEQAETAEDSFHVVVITKSQSNLCFIKEEDYGHAQNENQERVFTFVDEKLGANVWP